MLQGFKLAHKASGFIMIFVSQLAVLTGILRYNAAYFSSNPLAYIAIATFFIGLFLTEVAYRLYRRQDPIFKSVKEIMTIEEFNQRVSQGHKLSILDDRVLDVGPFLDEHPAGRFLVEYCVGKDMSKFFHGAYAIENYGPRAPKRFYHGYIPGLIVNDLTIAHLNRRTPVFYMKIVNQTPVNSTTSTYEF